MLMKFEPYSYLLKTTYHAKFHFDPWRGGGIRFSECRLSGGVSPLNPDVINFHGHFWATVCKTLRPVLSDHCLSVCLSVLPVCDVSVLWPNGWMDQNETWHGGRPRPQPHCVRWGPSSPPKRVTAPPNLRPMSTVAKRLIGSRCHLVGS